MTTLQGRVAVVTSASGGIGASLAAMLAAQGASVVRAARREAALERVATDIRQSGGSALPIVTDLAQDDSLANLVTQTRAEFGPIDILVNNAGYALWKPLEATSMAEWDQTFAVNLRAAAYLCATVLPEMQQRRFGRIVNIGSEAAVAIVPGLAAYCVSSTRRSEATSWLPRNADPQTRLLAVLGRKVPGTLFAADVAARESLNVDPKVAQISALLHQLAETHHVVFAITDGSDADWATWYADWLANLSSIGELLGVQPVRSELTYVLVGLDKEYTLQNPGEKWEDFYAARLAKHFATSG